MLQGRVRAWWILLSLLLTGCLGVNTGRPEGRGARNVKSTTRKDVAVAIDWSQILLGAGPKAKLMGYLKTMPTADGRTHWVYDTQFKLVGRVSPRGQTIAIRRNGREVTEGHFGLRHAMLKLFGHDKDRPITFRVMPPPQEG